MSLRTFYHFELAEHRPHLANVETNLGYLYFKINRLDEANEHLDRARPMSTSGNTLPSHAVVSRISLEWLTLSLQ